MKPVIKWPGGKSEEIERIAALVPEFARYHEPFLGGAAVFFHLEPASACLSDVNADLVGLYRAVADERPRLAGRLNNLCDAWDMAGAAGRGAAPAVTAGFGALRASGERAGADALAKDALARQAGLLGDAQAVLGIAGRAPLHETVVKTLGAKLWRIHNAERRAGERWSDSDLAGQAETAVRAGFYTWLRDICAPADALGRAMVFFFLREFCYGAMFRLNRQGRFNIPYGGRSYNDKDLRAKVAHLVSDEVGELLGRSRIRLGDFGECLSAGLSRSDFVFCDPPYDSEFSDYDGHPFGRADQERLAAAFAASDAKVLLVVQATPFICDLYERAARQSRHRVVIDEYGKHYAYNVKGRNEQAATHLAIRNYEL